MPRAPDPKKIKAKELYLSGMKLIDIANQLNLPEGTIRGWKSRYKWDCNATKKKCNATKHRGAPKGNKNAFGNSGGSAPKENKNAVKHGLFEKYLPKETLDIVNNMSLNPLDILWDNIQIAYAAIVRAQQISFVQDKDDKTTSKIAEGYSDTGSSEKWEVQQAWDKQANFMKAQARAQSELRSLIKQYDTMLHNNWELATEEQKLRIQKLKVDISKANGDTEETESDGFVQALESSVKGVWKD